MGNNYCMHVCGICAESLFSFIPVSFCVTQLPILMSMYSASIILPIFRAAAPIQELSLQLSA